MHFEEVMEHVVQAFEVVGVAVLTCGSILAFVAAAGHREPAVAIGVRTARRGVGRAVLLGLEVLIIADIVATITIDQTLEAAP